MAFYVISNYLKIHAHYVLIQPFYITVGVNVLKQKNEKTNIKFTCPVSSKCGACQMLDIPYEKQLNIKQNTVDTILKGMCKVHKITGMENPLHYRNKVHAVFSYKNGKAISGIYEEKSHRVIPVENCIIEDETADAIINTIRSMVKSFKIKIYDEDTGYGFLRHVLVRRGFSTGEVMVVIVTASQIFPSKNNFIKALIEKHPEITTIVQNINDRSTSIVLGEKENVLYGNGYIEDIICGCRFRISSKSFFQVNPVQTEKIYECAVKAAGLTGEEIVIDAYCGIGTIGLIAANHSSKVIGVELNKDAVEDAIYNAKQNNIKNIRFYKQDAADFMSSRATTGKPADIVFLDPPRAGSNERFIHALSSLSPDRVVYISCNPITLARDLKTFKKYKYDAVEAWPFDMFPFTKHVETVVLMSRVSNEPCKDKA